MVKNRIRAKIMAAVAALLVTLITAGALLMTGTLAQPLAVPPNPRIFTGELTDFNWNNGNVKDGQTSINSFAVSFIAFPAKGRQFKGNKDYVTPQKFDEIIQRTSLAKNEADAIFTAIERTASGGKIYDIQVAFFDDRPFTVDGSLRPPVVLPAGWRVFSGSIAVQQSGNSKKEVYALQMHLGLLPPVTMEIDVITVRHSSIGRTMGLFQIDLKNKSFSQYRISPETWDSREENLEFVRWLDNGRIEVFLAAVDACGFLDWEESYIREGHYDERTGQFIYIADGHQWSVTIVFSDGTEKITWGSNAYPGSYRDMASALRALTGEDVL